MQAFRNAAKPVVYVITITFLSWMILDLERTLTGGKGGFFSRTSVGSVNGEPIEIKAFQTAVSNAMTQRQRATGSAATLEDREQVSNEVWNSFIESSLINAEIDKHRIGTTPDEITEYIKNVPPQEFTTQPDLQTNGKFDLSKYQRWLAGPLGQQYVPMLEAQSRDQILRNRLFVGVTADVYLSDAASLGWRYRDQNEKVKISLTPIVAKMVIPGQRSLGLGRRDQGVFCCAHERLHPAEDGVHALCGRPAPAGRERHGGGTRPRRCGPRADRQWAEVRGRRQDRIVGHRFRSSRR